MATKPYRVRKINDELRIVETKNGREVAQLEKVDCVESKNGVVENERLWVVVNPYNFSELNCVTWPISAGYKTIKEAAEAAWEKHGK